ncbi:hypothetical protein Tco_1276239 [Tanacetum coccineum]
MSTIKFAETHNLVVFLDKPEESNGFEEIINFLNTSSVQYALTVNPTIYTTCIEQFWTSAKAKTVNGGASDTSLSRQKEEQIVMEEEVARNLKAQLQAELEEEERISRLKEEKANIALLESWDTTQAMMDTDFQLA